MRHAKRIALLGLTLLATGALGAKPAPRTAAAILADDASMLAGNWTIAALDGAPPVEGRLAALSFDRNSYGGSTGCNSFGGMFLAHGARLYTNPGPQTQIGCGGALGKQEARINALLRSSPRISLAGYDGIVLTDRSGSLSLRRAPGTPRGPNAPPIRPLRAGAVRIELIAFDGEPLRTRHVQAPSWLNLSGTKWEARVAGASFAGTVRRAPELRFTAGTGRRGTAPHRFFNGPVRTIVDVNGDVLMAGEGHWLTGRIPPAQKK